MKCIILAAGYATRMYPLTENFPKPLLEVGGKAILDWLTEDLSPAVEEFIVISNHKFAEQFRTWAEQKPYKITVLDDGTTSNEARLGAVKDIQFAVGVGDFFPAFVDLLLGNESVLLEQLQYIITVKHV